jgi:F-type H+-transporting ATPase subunit delta
MSVVNSYAKALYEAAIESQNSPEFLDTVENQLDTFLSILTDSKEARAALLAPITNTGEKLNLIEEFSKKLNLNSIVKQFLSLLARKERLFLLKEIRDSFSDVRLIQEGGVSGQLVSAEAMSEADMSSLAEAFSKKFGKKVAFRVSTDPSLLAGMKVTVNGVTYDGTLRSQLQKLRDRFVAGLPSAHA